MLVICPLLPNLCRFSLLQDGTTLTATSWPSAMVQQRSLNGFRLIRGFASCQGEPPGPLPPLSLFISRRGEPVDPSPSLRFDLQVPRRDQKIQSRPKLSLRHPEFGRQCSDPGTVHFPGREIEGLGGRSIHRTKSQMLERPGVDSLV